MQNEEQLLPYSLKDMEEIARGLCKSVADSLTITRFKDINWTIKGLVTQDDSSWIKVKDPVNGNILSVTRNSADKLKPYLNTLVYLKGTLDFALSNSLSGIFFNFDVHSIHVAQEENEKKAVNPLQPVIDCVRDASVYSFGTKPFPDSVKTLTIIHSRDDRSQIKSDVKGYLHEFKKQNIEPAWKPIAIADPKEIAKAIEDANDSQILFFAQGGNNTGAFSAPRVLEALAAAPKEQFIVMGLGHAEEIPLGYLFADLKAETPALAAELLNNMLRGSQARITAEKKASRLADQVEQQKIALSRMSASARTTASVPAQTSTTQSAKGTNRNEMRMLWLIAILGILLAFTVGFHWTRIMELIK